MAGINDLSDKLLLIIFKYFKAEELAMELAFVNTRWKTLTTNLELWTNLVFMPSHTMSDQYICECLKKMPELCHINIQYALDIDLITDYLCNNCPKIKTMVFTRRRGPCRLRLNRLLVKYPNAECIDVHIPGTQFQMDYSLWYNFHKAPKRLMLFAQNSMSSEVLGSKNCKVTNVYEASPQQLDSLILENKHVVESLALVSFLTSSTFDILNECRELKHLLLFNLKSNGIDTNFMFLQNLKKLESLQLCLWDISYWGISTPPSKMNLHNLLKLELAYSGCFTNEYISTLLMSSPSLEYLHLQTNDLNDIGLEPIKNCKRLIHIDLAFNVKLTNNCLKYIAAGCLNLRYLNVSFCFGIREGFVEILAVCSKLEEIRLQHIVITPKCLNLIPAKFPNIAVLDVRHCFLLTNKSVRELKVKFRKLRVMICRKPHIECEEGYKGWPFIIPEAKNFESILKV